MSLILAVLALIAFVNGLPHPGRLSDYDEGPTEVPKAIQSRGPNPFDDFTDSNETQRKYFI